MIESYSESLGKRQFREDRQETEEETDDETEEDTWEESGEETMEQRGEERRERKSCSRCSEVSETKRWNHRARLSQMTPRKQKYTLCNIRVNTRQSLSERMMLQNDESASRSNSTATFGKDSAFTLPKVRLSSLGLFSSQTLCSQ